MTPKALDGGLAIGSHMSTAGGVDKAPARGASVDCTAMQIFVKNNQRWEGPPITDEAAEAYRRELARTNIPPDAVFAHTCYLINLASTKEDLVRKSVAALEDELNRCDKLGVPGLVMHPGAHLGQGRDAGIAQIARLCREIFARTTDNRTRLLFETTVGTGTNIGGEFEDLRDILDAIDMEPRTGVCLDTCHIFAAGYDIREKKPYENTMLKFSEIIGFERLRAVHLNDSKFGLGERKDRHEHIGQGHIGVEGFRLLLNDARFAKVPMALETPKDKDMTEDRANLEVLRGLIGKKTPAR